MTTLTVPQKSYRTDRPLRSWGWLVALGAGLVLLGLAASTQLFVATIAATYLTGAMMFAGGVLQLAHGVTTRRWPGATFWFLSGLLYLVAAASVLYDPLFAARLLTLLIGVALGVSGFLRAGIAVRWFEDGRGWLLVSGIVSIAAAAIIAIGWPANSLWVLGLVLSVDLIVQGIALMLIGLTLKAAQPIEIEISVSS